MTLSATDPVLSVRDLDKGFTLHLHGGKRLPVVSGVNFDLHAGECLVTRRPLRRGQVLRAEDPLRQLRRRRRIAADPHRGAILDLAQAEASAIIEVRRETLGYVSQFLRVIPRVPALDIVAEPAMAAGYGLDEARERAAGLLAQLNLPERLWSLPPRYFLGRRAAAREHRARLRRQAPDPHPRRADRLARRCQPRGLRRVDASPQGGWLRLRRYLP